MTSSNQWITSISRDWAQPRDRRVKRSTWTHLPSCFCFRLFLSNRKFPPTTGKIFKICSSKSLHNETVIESQRGFPIKFSVESSRVARGKLAGSCHYLHNYQGSLDTKFSAANCVRSCFAFESAACSRLRAA